MILYKIPLIITFILLLCSCSSTTELERLKAENSKLKKEIAAFDNAIVLTHDNINKYVSAVTFSALKAKKNEPVEFVTCLTLDKLPKNVTFKWKSKPDGMKVEGKGVTQYVENTYPTVGKRSFHGEYTVVFPNGEEWSIPWEREYTIE